MGMWRALCLVMGLYGGPFLGVLYALLFCIFLALLLGRCSYLLLWFLIGALWSIPTHLPVNVSYRFSCFASEVNILSWPNVDKHKVNTRLVCAMPGGKVWDRGEVVLSWPEDRVLPKPGEYWALSVVFPGPSKHASAWSKARGAYVPFRGDMGHYVSRIRVLRGREKLLSQLYRSPYSMKNIMAALVLGDRSQMTQDLWSVFRHTGTAHLLAISGLHVGFIYGAVHKVVGLFSRHPHLPIARLPAVLLAWCYGGLSGFAPPVLRALVMLSVMFFSKVLAVEVPISTLFFVALGVVGVWDPSCLQEKSVWLSFMAIAGVWYVTSQNRSTSLWRLQWILPWWMLPTSIGFFSQLTPVGWCTNLFAIPWLSVGILPLVFLGVITSLLFPIISHALLFFANFQLEYLVKCLSVFSQVPGAFFALTDYQTKWGLLWALIFWCVLAIPAWHWKKFFWNALLFSSVPLWPVRDLHRMQMRMLDVGQGLSVVVTTPHHALVFDTGGLWHVDTGKKMVLPYLQSMGVHTLDMVMVSHGDWDHRGGLQSLLATIPTKEVLSGEPEKVLGSLPCRFGMHWVWDGVKFRVLYPTTIPLKKGNESSCVLSIAIADTRIWLTGDMSTRVEKWLWEKQLLEPVRVLQVPHHGSRSASSRLLLETLKPHYALCSSGLHNRYHLPAPNIVTRYQSMGSVWLNTATRGDLQISWDLSGNDEKLHALG